MAIIFIILKSFILLCSFVFFLFLLLMILAGAAFSKLAHGSNLVLVAIAALDLSIAIALLSSSYVFWKMESPG